MQAVFVRLRLGPLTIGVGGYLALVGSVINTFDPYPSFYSAMALALAAYFVSLYSLGWFNVTNSAALAAVQHSPAFANNWAWFTGRCHSRTTLVTSLAFAAGSIAEFHFLGIVPLSPIGLVIDVVLMVTLTIAGVGYNYCIRFLILLGRIIRLGVIAFPRYRRLVPRDSVEARQLRGVAVGMSLGFGAVGLLFTILYSIVAPVDRIASLTKTLELRALVFAYSWAVIAVFIIAAWVFLTLLPFLRIGRLEDQLAQNARFEIASLVSPPPVSGLHVQWLRDSARAAAVIASIGPDQGLRGILRSAPLLSTGLQLAAALISVREFVDAIEWLQSVM